MFDNIDKLFADNKKRVDQAAHSKGYGLRWNV